VASSSASASSGSRTAAPTSYRFLRYLAPNAVTCASLVFGMISATAAHHGNFALAGWMIVYAALTDRLDGMVARAVRGTSELGVQLDSFADFMNFGLAPAFLMYTFLESHPALGFAGGWKHVLLIVAGVAWVLGAVFRLARFNVASEDGVPTQIFFGIPTTLAGGLLVIWFLALLKYAPPDVYPHSFGGAKLLGSHVSTPNGVWTIFPFAMLLGAFLMASSLRMLKVGKTPRKATTAFVLINVVLGYGLGFARLFPEWMLLLPSAWIVVFLVWGQLSAKAQAYLPPPLFPRAEAEDGMVRMRPQEDLAPEDDAV
jgi:CDP-diacylglycerol--serine O-phosphatidyltransferase